MSGEIRKDLIIKGGIGLTLASGIGAFCYLRSKTDHVFEDLIDTLDLYKIRWEVRKRVNSKDWTIVDLFNDALAKNPNGEAIRFVDANTAVTYREMEEYSNRSNVYFLTHSFIYFHIYNLHSNNKNKPPSHIFLPNSPKTTKKVANWGITEGLVQGDVVGLIMDNKPEYVITWLGLAKIGVVTALINTHLIGSPLIHSLSVCKANHFIIGLFTYFYLYFLFN